MPGGGDVESAFHRPVVGRGRARLRAPGRSSGPDGRSRGRWTPSTRPAARRCCPTSAARRARRSRGPGARRPRTLGRSPACRLAGAAARGSAAGQRLRLRVDEAGAERVAPAGRSTARAAAAAGGAPATAAGPGRAYALALPGGASARAATSRSARTARRAAAARARRGRSPLRYDSPRSGRLDLRLDARRGGRPRHAPARPAARRRRGAAEALRDALARATGAPVPGHGPPAAARRSMSAPEPPRPGDGAALRHRAGRRRAARGGGRRAGSRRAILELAREAGVPVREDPALAEALAALELEHGDPARSSTPRWPRRSCGPTRSTLGRASAGPERRPGARSPVERCGAKATARPPPGRATAVALGDGLEELLVGVQRRAQRALELRRGSGRRGDSETPRISPISASVMFLT